MVQIKRKMNVKILLISTLSIFCATSASEERPFACARKFLQKEKISNFIIVNAAEIGHKESPIDSFFRSIDCEYDWSITVVSNLFRAMGAQRGEMPKNVILFASSPADIDPVYANVQMTNTRLFVVLTNAHSSRQSIRSIFRKFDLSMQSQVEVMERSGDNSWKFYKYVDDRCSSNEPKSLVMVAECNDGATGVHIRYLSNGLPVKGKSCPLIVAARQFEPFTYYDDVKGFYNGIDYLIVKTISERLQLDVKFVRTGNGSRADPETIE